MKAKSITFILPGQGNKPSGGFKVVYEYANYLAINNWNVEIIHIAWLHNTASLLKGILKFFFFFLNYKPSHWITLDKRIKTRWVFKLYTIYTKRVVATAWETAELLYRYWATHKKLMIYYLIQADESQFDEVVKYNWQNRVCATWYYAWRKIVITDFLFELVSKCDKDVIKIYNGIDFTKYHIVTPIEKRNKYRICMMAHIFEWKGTKTGVNAFIKLKQKFPDVQITLFSTYPKMSYIPGWINYEYLASQDRIIDIYNESAIFISCSYTEGFGLPFAEAMACGCATIVSDIPAYRNIGNTDTTIYFNIGDIHGLVQNIEFLFENTKKMIEYAYNGYYRVKDNFSLRKSSIVFEEFISS
jgi:glycosyltransferase involved in cell wall biosynthesis